MTSLRYLTALAGVFLVHILLLYGFGYCQDSGDQDSVDQSSGEQSISLQEFGAELDRQASICDQNELAEQAEISRRWITPKRNDQSVLYLPTPLEKESVDSTIAASWARHFNAARSRFAKHLFAEAVHLAATDEQRAYRLVWHTLRENPEHREAKQIMGGLARGVTTRPRLIRAREPSQEFGWQAGTYSRIETPHFLITTRADSDASLRLAQQLEEYYALWSQVFFPLWAPPGLVHNKLSGRNTPWPKQRGIEVIFLKDRAEYLQVLGVAEDKVGISVGYYNPGARKSFFYPSADLGVTLTHELTHQLLLEATCIDARPEAGSRSGIWMLEGIALYMESLQQHGSYWTVGGVDAPRLQTARYRGVRDGYWPSWQQFAAKGLEAWKLDPDLARLYSHAAGLTHVMLDSLGPESRNRYFQALVGLYQEHDASQQMLLDALGESEKQAKSNYQDQLVVKGQDLRAVLSSHAQPRDLVLCGSQLDSESWSLLSQFKELEWLDVSFSNVRDQDLQWLPKSQRIERLSLEGTAVSGDILKSVLRLPMLEELDLSGCAIDDQSLSVFKNQPTIKILWLTNTQVSLAALETLGSMPQLRQCDVQGSQISAPDWRKFVETHSRLTQ